MRRINIKLWIIELAYAKFYPMPFMLKTVFWDVKKEMWVCSRILWNNL
jgi:hypothetical protein